ncbi:LysR family transcriptional regulator [Paracandidimonas lactea]|uniref:LysR family transcriptional regulator n=1 Tax=Paracandidimonas lactea TaxID=2895524 RepID=UPI0034E2E040
MPQKTTTSTSLLQPGTVPDLSSRELQAICTVAECGSFMAAALTLNISQSALTRIVQRVESALGLELFRRSTRRVEISPAGQEFVDLANRVLSDLRISYENMQAISDEHRGSIIISAVMSVAYTQMPKIVASYRLRRPNIEIHLREGIHGTVMDDVRSGVADLGITYLDSIPKEFAAVELGSEVFHLVMPRNHPLSGKDGVRIEDLANTALVSMPRAAHIRKLLDGLASLAGMRLHHAITVNQFATMMQCVRAGVGIALVPSGAVPAALSVGLISRPLIEPQLKRAIGVLSLKHRSPAPAAAGFLAHLRANWNDGQ